jgi:hypothetical protein
MNGIVRFTMVSALVGLAWPLLGQSNDNVSQLLFETSFEVEDGYSEDADLIGQNGWIGFAGGDAFLETSDDGSTGLLTDFLEGQGQQAYIGFVKPDHKTNVEFLSLLQPLTYEPTDNSGEILRFSVSVGIYDSTNGERDNFRWSIYNTEGFRLFSLDFDNETRAISYALDDAEPLQATGFDFDNDTFYDLRIDIDFPGNKWSAWASDVLIVEDLPVSTQNLKRDLSDIDAVWAIFKTDAPGDNFMVFDNYRIEVIKDAPLPPILMPLGQLPNGSFVIRVKGQANAIYQVEATTDFNDWQVVQNKIDLGETGTIDWVDDTAPSKQQRFYRLK